MKHPYMVTWIDEAGKLKRSSFKSEGKRDRMAEALLGRNLTVWVADQMQLSFGDESQGSATYDPRYEIPF